VYRKLLLSAILILLCQQSALAWNWKPYNKDGNYALVVDPYTATAGNTVAASELNARYNTLYTLVNGNIDNANISSSANIDPAKLNKTVELGPILRTGTNRCISAGTAADTIPRFAVLPTGGIQSGPGGASALDMEFFRKDANTYIIRNVAATTNKNLEVGQVAVRLSGAANDLWQLSNLGLKAGAGGASAVDLLIDREDANTFQIRNAADSLYKDLHIGQLNLETALPILEGGTGTTSIGTGLQTVRLNAGNTALEGFTPVAAFGGDGGSGAVTKGTTSDTVTQINATTFTQTVSTTYTPESGLVINSTGTAAFNGTTTVSDLANGSIACLNDVCRRADGCGNGGEGASNSTNPGGGGGGGFGGAGGTGGDNANDLCGLGGKASPFPGGSIGGAGGAGGCATTANGGTGGNRGGHLRVCTIGAITFGSSSTVQCQGSNGTAGTGNGGGGGGGAGGYQGYYSRTSITVSAGALVRCTGGNGGSAGSATGGIGSGGGGGRIVVMSPSNTLTAAPTCAAGTQGVTGRTTSATSGAAGVVTNITGVPSMPLISHIERTHGLDLLIANKRQPGEVTNLDGREVASWFSALYSRPGKARQLNTALLFGTQEENLHELTTVDCKGMGETPWVEQKSDIVEGDSQLLPAA
jgi:hypothetical protein